MSWKDYTRANLNRKRQTGPSPGTVGILSHEQFLVKGIVSRLRYRSWQFSNREAALIAFRAHPETGALQRLGPWPMPADAGEEEALAAAMLAVAETDGPDAVVLLHLLPPR